MMRANHEFIGGSILAGLLLGVLTLTLSWSVALHASGTKTLPQATSAASLAQPSLDLEELEARIRQTNAIGFFTKLELKGQVDDLLDDFRDFHEATGDLSLDELRERFNLLMLKVLSSLQDEDPELSGDIVVARPALWTVLSDPAKFAQATEG